MIDPKVVYGNDEGSLVAVGRDEVSNDPAVLVELANPVRLSKPNLAQLIAYLQEVHDAL